MGGYSRCATRPPSTTGIRNSVRAERTVMTRSGSKLLSLYRSSILKKIVTGITGLALVVFVLEHMIGNLEFLFSDAGFNGYAHFLVSLGPILWVVEIIFLIFLLFHMSIGIDIWIGKRKARGKAYLKYKSAGKPSRQSISSRSMVLTGIVLGAFLVFHLLAFKYGTYYETTVDGVVMRDLARLMREKFALPGYAFGYPALVILLILHMRHGIWSAFQSLGATKPSMTPLIIILGGLLGLAIGAGFIVVPLAIYFGLV